MHCRFKPENILMLELDMPERTTFDYNAAGMDRAQLQVCKRHREPVLPAAAACSDLPARFRDQGPAHARVCNAVC